MSSQTFIHLVIIGQRCETCQDGFFGNPVNGGYCYHTCQPKSIIQEQSGYLGCKGQESECLWIIKAPDDSKGIIELQWDTKYPNNDCKSTTSHMEVYDGLPPFIVKEADFDPLGSFCLNDPQWKDSKLVAISGREWDSYIVLLGLHELENENC